MIELTAWWKQACCDSRPWLILGKGPTFSEHTRFDLSGYHTLALNHAVCERPVDVAHVIDLDVVADCGSALLENCRWLLMPRHPHVNCSPSEHPLEFHFDEYPVLAQLARENRLVWYNLGSHRPYENSPVIPVRFFSAEAAVGILAELGVKRIRSLGVDGGRGYSSEFQQFNGKTMLANGHDTFDLQFREIERIVQENGIDYAALAEPMRVFVGMDESQRVAARVLEFSIRKHASRPVQVCPLFDIPLTMPRKRRNQPGTGFSFYRFAIPELCGFRGRGLYVDADMQVFTDLASLWDIPFEQHKVLCTNQSETPEFWKKNPAGFHPGRQMSVMLLDCSRLDWDMNSIVGGLDAGRYTYQQLMFELCIVDPDEIADRIPPEWNCLEWYEPGRSKLSHYTVVTQQPWKNKVNPLRSVWLADYRDALEAGAVSPGEVLFGIQAGHLDPSLADDIPTEIDRDVTLAEYSLRRDVAHSVVAPKAWKRWVPRPLRRLARQQWNLFRNVLNR